GRGSATPRGTVVVRRRQSTRRGSATPSGTVVVRQEPKRCECHPSYGAWSAAFGRANPLCRRVASGRGHSAARARAIQVSRCREGGRSTATSLPGGSLGSCREALVRSRAFCRGDLP